MLPNEQTALWNKIREFPLDESGAEITFSRKLREQQKWTAEYTVRVIEEYRKFIFLCCILPKGASPSKAVDEAWHLHLTYTKSYWTDFCKNTLGKEIHHYPSKGGDTENHKHVEWYKETLDIYRNVFGYEAPSDIWPKPVRHNLEISEQFNLSGRLLISAAVVILLPFLFSVIAYGEINPYDLSGPEFLAFYPLFAVAVVGVYVLIQIQKRNFYSNLVEKYFTNDATIFQQAQFLYGKDRALQAAIVDLVRRDLLILRDDQQFVVHNNRYIKPESEVNPLIPGYLEEKDGRIITYDSIAAYWYKESKFWHPAIEKLQEFTRKKQSFWENGIYTVVILIAGVVRFIQGMLNDRPILFLVVEIVLLLVMQVMLRSIFDRGNLVHKLAEKIFINRTDVSQLHPDFLVRNFAYNGYNELAVMQDGVILATLFSASTPAENISKPDGNYSSGSNTAFTCGSGGGDSSCGSGAGCGGCGGGGGGD